MPGSLTTHVLDTACGRPASGLRIELYRVDGDNRTLLQELTTNADGRTDSPCLAPDHFRPGIYELVFHAGSYLRRENAALNSSKEGTPLFLDQIPIRFGLAEPVHYHVPLLLSPYSYSTYRGS